MYYVYLIKSKKNEKIYIGYTSDLKRRLSEHNMGINIFTNRYKPWELIYYEAFKNKQDAQNREMKLKHHGNGIRLLKERLLSSLKNGAGFTLIETIVVIAVIAITLPILTVIIMTLTRMQLKIYRLSQVKREGDYVLNVMANAIKDRAVSIHIAQPDDTTEICKNTGSNPGSGNSLFFLDKDKEWFGYELSTDTIVAKSPPAVSNSLTSAKIKILNFTINCSRNTIFSPPSVFLSFDICYDTESPNCATSRPEEIAKLHYQTQIKIRSY